MNVPCTDLALERRCVSALIHTPESAMEPVWPSAFSDPQCEAIVRCVLHLVGTNEPVTPMAIVTISEQNGLKRIIGDLEGVFAVMEMGGIERDVVNAVARVKRLHEARTLRTELLMAISQLEEGDLEAAKLSVLDAAEGLRTDETRGITTAFDLQRDAMQEMLVDGAGKPRIVTGLKGIDEEIGFVSGGDLIIIGADTGVGKTSALMSMARQQAADGVRVGFISCEDGRMVLGSRLLATHARISSHDMRMGKLNADDMGKLHAALERTRHMGIHFSFEVGSTDLQVCQAMTKLVRDHGCGSLMVDYVQAVNPSSRGQSRKEDIRTIASRLKGTSARLGVPLFLASQLTRPPQDKRDSGRIPTKHDLKEAGDLENMAEYILLLWRGSMNPQDDEYHHVAARLAKSKVGGDGKQLILVRDRVTGTLQERRYA